ncbi:hypothetical protein CTAYLR_003697 [Chrysophaeum taylorii]|uniref:Ubiquitin-like domain-containing protein n=1 Tax=Chrysophaeum taylorii TaxID=2483200 RepID=A0AAD7XR43_9STRA|nr:hypothetical protein CTAYLR_003697 [Chrysophaeum taylorii]
MRLRCVGENGAVARREVELDSEYVGDVAPFQVCTAVEALVATNGTERVRLEAPLEGWVSRRLFEPLTNDGELRVGVDYRAGNVSLRQLAVLVDADSAVADLKQSLEAMTRVPTDRQLVSYDDRLLRDTDRIADLNALDGRVALVVRASNAPIPPVDDPVDEHPVVEEVKPYLPHRGNFHSGTLLAGGFTTTKRKPNFGCLPDENAAR